MYYLHSFNFDPLAFSCSKLKENFYWRNIKIMHRKKWIMQFIFSKYIDQIKHSWHSPFSLTFIHLMISRQLLHEWILHRKIYIPMQYVYAGLFFKLMFLGLHSLMEGLRIPIQFFVFCHQSFFSHKIIFHLKRRNFL